MLEALPKDQEDSIITGIKEGKTAEEQDRIEDAIQLATYYTRYMLIKPFRFIRVDAAKSQFLMMNSPAVSTKDASINAALEKLNPGFFTVIYTDPNDIETFVGHNAATTEFLRFPQTKEDFIYNINESEKVFKVFEKEEIDRKVIIDLLVRLMIKDS